jgi:hypothetical protein
MKVEIWPDFVLFVFCSPGENGLLNVLRYVPATICETPCPLHRADITHIINFCGLIS